MRRPETFQRWTVQGLIALMMAAGTVAWAEGADRIVAAVNGEAITEAEFYDRLQRVRATDFLLSQNPPRLRSDAAGQLVLNSMILEKLILQWAVKTKQMPTEAEINAEVEADKKRPTVAQALANSQLSEAALRYAVTVELARFNLATTAASVSPQEVEAYYKAHLADYTMPERWGLSAIRTSKQENIPKIQAALKAGKPFSDLVQTYSDDPRSKGQGGQLGVVNANDPGLPQAIRDAVKPLPVGGVTPPLKIGYSVGGKEVIFWWLVRLTSREPGTSRPFSEIKTQVERQALLERAGGYPVADKKIEAYRAQSIILVNLPAYKNLANTPQKS